MKKNLIRGFNWIKKHPWWTFFIFMVTVISLMVLPKRITSAVKGPEAKYQTTSVKKSNLLKTVSASGKIKSQNQVDLKFQTSGLLAWVGVKEGDQVKKWQAIASLDKREMQKNLEKALRDYSEERNDFEEEYRVTYRQQTPSTALTDTVKRILEKNQWDLEKAVLDVELKDLSLKYSKLISPISGIVTRVDTPVAGVNIVYTTSIFKVADPTSTYFSAEVDETDVARIREGQEAQIAIDAYGDEKFIGKVKKIYFSSITTSGGGTAYLAEISLPQNSAEQFKIGMNGDVDIKIARKEGTLIVSSDAIREKDGKKFVQILKDDNPQEMEITTGLTSDSQVEITSGLQEGETVILAEKK